MHKKQPPQYFSSQQMNQAFIYNQMFLSVGETTIKYIL